ncbi:MAG: hypothetical protein CMF74_10215 [Maricaulis sp.]|nr:hypothetical protein [Maricaulis sp.]
MEENKENIVEEVQQEQTVEETKDQDTVKVKMKSFDTSTQDVYKVDLSKTNEDANTEQSTDEVPVRDESETSEEVRDENVEEPIEEVTEQGEQEKKLVEEVKEEPKVEVTKNEKGNIEIKIPDSVEKLVSFMEETGGTLEDYVSLNKDYSNMDNQDALYEYYKKTKPHLTAEEINFLMEDQFSYDEETDDERDIRRKKLALKEQVANAKSFLDGQKSKYYEEVKSSAKLTQEQQQAVEFFNSYKQQAETTQQAKKVFDEKTNNVFNQDFKGFDFNVGEKTFRYKVNNADEIKNNQSDITNFVKKFLNEDGTMKDAAGYHKSLFTASNADAIARHFYEQGRADALKNSFEKSKNIDMQPRQSHQEVEVEGTKYKVLSGDSSSKLKFKIKN